MTQTVSMFADAFGDEPKDADLGALLGEIRSGRWRAQIEKARELFADWKEVCPALDSKDSPEAKAYDHYKKTLATFCVSGRAKSRKEPLTHSGLLQVDCDKLNGKLDALREQLKADPHIAFGFVSPSGDGLKLGLAVDGTRHAESFAAAERYFRESYNIEIDPAVKDRLRLCFVSYDPELWIRENPQPLPIADAEAATENTSGAELAGIVLPSGPVSITECAKAIFKRIGPSHTLFWRGGAIVEVVVQEGIAGLHIVQPDAFRTRVERFAMLFAWRSGGDGEPKLKSAKMSRDDAAAIMASLDASELLPPVASVLRCPVLVESGDGVRILGQGYHPELGGLLILAGEEPPRVPVDEAVRSLKWLLEEFKFQSEGDRSRGVANFITPALRMGGFLSGPVDHVPIDVAEADQSQAGKGYRHSLVCALYGESEYLVTCRKGGVGSTDESFSSALISGRPFIRLDNIREKLDSQNLEAFLTCPTLFGARIPHHGEIMVNPKRHMLQMSSNGMEATRDLANRSSICRIRKRPGYNYRDTLAALQRRQPYFLGCVFSIIAEWLSFGKPRSQDTRHDFRTWAQTLDWIVTNICGCAPLMDDHEAAQERVSNPVLSWVRQLALALEGEGRLGEALVAGDLVELCNLQGFEIPGLGNAEENRAKLHVGLLMRRAFRDSDQITADGYTVTRGRRDYRKPSGDLDSTPEYTFSK
jgi:hypothetical protein